MSRSWKLWTPTALGALGMVAGCGGRVGSDLAESDALQQGAEFAAFAAISKALVSGDAGSGLVPDVQTPIDTRSDFYLAIRKSALAERWFLSATFKQYYPGGAAGWSNTALGTRVVRFEVQNDKLFVFDASDQLASSRVEDPAVLVEAYPIVDAASTSVIPSADEYVLVDVAAGLNRIGITADTYADPTYSWQATPLVVGLSFMQNFRELQNGAAFEQVFSGVSPSAEDGSDEQTWGTLGISLRRYHEGEGYVPPDDPDKNHLFFNSGRILPDSGGEVELESMIWNFHPGMTPLTVSIRGGALRAAADFPQADVIGALVRGIEGYNDVFGFPVFKAEVVDSDERPGDDELFLMVDYPGSDVQFAFADFQANPNTGEALSGSVYLSGVFFDVYVPEPEAEDGAGQDDQEARAAAPRRSFTWGDAPPAIPVCRYPALRARAASEATPEFFEQGDRYMQHVITHEFGHVLGLRHNFKGSLIPPTSSVMDYLMLEERAAQPAPGPYDVDAIRYFYHLSDAPPAQPFCTDEDLALDPTCAMFDRGVDPLHQAWIVYYRETIQALLDAGEAPAELDSAGLNELLAFARDGADGSVPQADRREALAVALEPTAVPGHADSARVDFANTVAELVLRRTVLDAPELRGDITFDVTDPEVIELLSQAAGTIVRNAEGVRPDSLRRTAIDVLAGLQSTIALGELRKSEQVLKDELAHLRSAYAEDALLIQDLLERIEAATSPYFR